MEKLELDESSFLEQQDQRHNEAKGKEMIIVSSKLVPLPVLDLEDVKDIMLKQANGLIPPQEESGIMKPREAKRLVKEILLDEGDMLEGTLHQKHQQLVDESDLTSHDY